MKTFIIFILLHVLVISAQQVKLPYHTLMIPPNTLWAKCAKAPKMASYAIKLSQNKALDPTYYDGKYYQIDYEYTKVISQAKYGFFAELSNTTIAIPQSRCGTGNSNEEITGLATACMRQFPIPYPGPWCLAIGNTHNFAQTVDVVLSFTQSVFVEGTYRTDSSTDKAFTLGKSSLTGTFDNNNKRRNIKRSNPLRLGRSF